MTTKPSSKKAASKPSKAKRAAPTKGKPAKPAQAKQAAIRKAPHKPEAKAAKATRPALKVQPAKTKAEAVTKTAPKAAPKPPVKPGVIPAKDSKTAHPQPGKPADGKVLPQGKIGAKAGAPGTEPTGPREDADSPLLDMSDVAVRKMITRAKQRGYVTYDELNKVLPSDKVSSEQIEDTMAMLNEMGINVIESDEQDETAEVPALATGKAVTVKTGEEEEQYDRTDDPVRMYLREMGSVELLSREGEIAIAKRIEAGRELMIGATS